MAKHLLAGKDSYDLMQYMNRMCLWRKTYSVQLRNITYSITQLMEFENLALYSIKCLF